jgi:hypothetical protein
MLRVILRALIEWTRRCTFGRGGFQQMQVDLATMHAALPLLAAPSAASALPADQPWSGAGEIEALLHEAAASAAERCVEDAGASMEPSVLYAIVTAKLAGLDLVVGSTPS